MSERETILNAVIAALGTISVVNGYATDVKYVSDKLKLKHPQELDKNKFPACFPIDGDEVKEGYAIGTSGDNVLSTITIIVTSMVYEDDGDTLTARSDLIKDVEKAIVTDAALTALLIERATPTTVETDKGYFDRYSVFSQEFELRYLYNHESGG